jgi:hypothetical protein
MRGRASGAKDAPTQAEAVLEIGIPLKLGRSRLSSSFNGKILLALPDGEGSGPWEEFMAEDFCDEDVLGHVLGLKRWQQIAA